MVDFPIRVVLKTDQAVRGARQVERSLSRVERGADRVGRRGRRGFSQAGRGADDLRRRIAGLRTAVAGLSSALAARQVVDAGRRFQNLERRIRSVSNGADDTRRNLNLIRQVSEQTGTSIEQNASTFARLSIATRNLGINSTRTAGIVRTLNQALVLGGAGAQEAAATVTQLGQALASGRLQGDELRSLLENAPLLAEQLAQQLGITIGELRELGASGELTSDRLIAALEGAAGSIDAEFQNLGPSFDQSLARLENSVVELGEAFGPLIANLGTSIELLADFLGQANELLSIGRRLRQQQGDISQNDILSEAGRLRDQTLRLGNQAGLFEGGEAALGADGINQRASGLQSTLSGAGLRAEDVRQLVESLREQGLTGAAARAEIERLLGVTNLLGEAQQRGAAATEDFVGSKRRQVEVEQQATAAAAAAEVVQRRTVRTLQNQIQNLENEARLLQVTGVEREVLEQRLRAENSLRRAGIDLTTEQAQAQIGEVEALARANAERREALRIQQEAAGDTENLDEQIEKTRTFAQTLDDANARAQNLGATIGDALVGAIDSAANAFAEFIVTGADNVEQLREQLSNILRDLARQILAAIIRALILRAILGPAAPVGAARTGAAVTPSRKFVVGEGGGAELFVPSRSPLAQSVAASRATRRVSNTASRFAGRQTGGPVVPGGGRLLTGPSLFEPPEQGTVVPAAQTSAFLQNQSRGETVVVQAKPPVVEVQVTNPVMLNGKLVRDAIREDDDVRSEVVQTVREERDGIST